MSPTTNCTYKEVYDFMQKYRLVRQTYYKPIGGTYVQQNQTLCNNVTKPGAPCARLSVRAANLKDIPPGRIMFS
jgi:ribulose kinase